MAKDFFDELGGTLSKTAQSLTEKVGSVYETSKLKSKISGEARMAEKLMADIGRIIYARFAEGGEVDEDLRDLCEEIRGHEEVIDELKANAAGRKGLKICPSCKKEVSKDALFCPYCGAPLPVPEPEEVFEEVPEEVDAGGIAESAEEAAAEMADAVAEACEKMEAVSSEALEKAAETASEAGDAVTEAVEEAVDTAADMVDSVDIN